MEEHQDTDDVIDRYLAVMIGCISILCGLTVGIALTYVDAYVPITIAMSCITTLLINRLMCSMWGRCYF